MTPRTACTCGRALVERRELDLAISPVLLVSRDGYKRAHNCAVHCEHCNNAYHSHYTQLWKQRNDYMMQPWMHDDHALGLRSAVMSNKSLAMEWEFSKDLDARMLWCPFTWTMLVRECNDRFLQDGVKLKCKTLARHLSLAWQWYILMTWRQDCQGSGMALPPVGIIRNPSKPCGQPLFGGITEPFAAVQERFLE